MEAFGWAAVAGFLYKMASNFPGIVLLALSLFALIVFLWKHKSPDSGYKFSFRYVTDWAVLLLIFGGFSLGGFLLLGRLLAPAEKVAKCFIF